MIQPAERAFIEGIILYPYSPECTIRYMREILYPYGRLDEAILYVENLVYKDVNNSQAQNALGMLKDLRHAQERTLELKELNDKLIAEFNKANPTAKINQDILILPDDQMLELVKAANVLGNTTLRYVVIKDYFVRKKIDYKIAGRMLEELISFHGATQEDMKLINLLPADFFNNVEVEIIRVGADAYMKAGNYKAAMNCLSKVLSKDPNDWRSWASYSLLLAQSTQKLDASFKFIEKAEQTAQAKGEYLQFHALLRSVPELEYIYKLLHQQRANNANGLPMGAGMIGQ
jgi:tetratricopeptide (TPR) repeat protein